MEKLNGYIYFDIDEFELSVLLPTHDVEIYSGKNVYSFYLTKGAHLVINGFDYGDSLVTIDKKSGEITSGIIKPIDVSARLVDEFIAQNPDLHDSVRDYLKCNPHDLFQVHKGSNINVLPVKWVMVSDELKEEYEGFPLSVLIGGCIGVKMAEKFEQYINKK